jgi:hypothetical protein
MLRLEMRAVRAGAGIALATAVTTALAATAIAASPLQLVVAPASGHRSTTFTVHFVAPAASGIYGTTTHGYSLVATGPRQRSGCTDSVALAPVASSAGEAMAVRLRPARGQRWCGGRFTGHVDESSRPNCGPPVAERSEFECPQFVLVDRIGDFRFKVAK